MDNTSIIEAIRAGSKEAIQKVYTENAKDVYEFTNSLIHDSAKSKEITRVTFVTLFRKISAGENPSDLRIAAMKEAYEEAVPFMPKKTPEQEEEVVLDEPEVIVKEVTQNIIIPKEEIDAAEAEAEEAPEAEAEETPEPIENSADMAEEIKTRLSQAAEKEAEAAESYSREAYETGDSVDDIVLEEDVQLVRDEPEDFYEDEPEEKSVHHTQVIDISEAPEESDVIIEEAVEEYERGEYEDEYEYDEDYYDDDDDYYDDDEEDRPKKKGFFTVLVIINIILILLLLWLLCGLLVNLGVLPESLDLGYTWFNETIFPIF